MRAAFRRSAGAPLRRVPRRRPCAPASRAAACSPLPPASRPAAAAGVAVWRFGPFRGGAAGPTSVAVIPFENLSDSPDQGYFSDGLSEELRATLARNAGLQVMAEASSRQFRASKDDAVTIADKLGVDYLLNGKVRRAGDEVRVTVDVIDGGTGFSRWSQIFERALSDIFAVQAEIATVVASGLMRRFAADGGAPAEVAASIAGGTRNIEAYDAYLRGRALYDLSADEASERAALAQFDAAIAADPGYAAAHAARARSLTAIANQYGKVGELDALYDAAIASAERAIGIAPELADAHSTLGFTLFQGRLDARAAREPFERSRELGAGEATVLARYAQYSARCGRHRQAGEAMERALLLDRLNPLIHRAAGAIAYAARRWEDSIAPARQGLAMNPRLSRAHAAIGDALLMLGRMDEARAEYLAEPVEDFRLAGIAIVERRRGDAGAAEARARAPGRRAWRPGAVSAGTGTGPVGAARPGDRGARARQGAGRLRADLRPERSLPGPAAGRCAVHEVAESPGLRLGCAQPAPVEPGTTGRGNYMRNMTTALAAALAMLALAACAKKEEPPAAPPASRRPAEVAPAAPPTETPPADANSEDAEQSGGDKVKP